MTAHSLNITANDLIGALTKLTETPARVGDLYEWVLDEKGPGAARHLLTAYRLLFNCELMLMTPVADLHAIVSKALDRERKRGQSRHWSYDMNRQIALRQMLDVVDAYRLAKEGV